MSVERSQLIATCDNLLQSPGMADYGPNGLQVEGVESIKTLATTCTASLAAIEEAAANGADALLVHHGLFWGKGGPITGALRRRLGVLIEASINLIAYHLPLDAAAVWGNNFVGLQALGIEEQFPFASHRGNPIGFYGDLPSEQKIEVLKQRCAEIFDHEVIHCPAGDSASADIRRIGMVSGGGQSHLHDAIDAGCDLFISGESSEQNWHDAQENSIHFFACGHFATENIAIHRLGAELGRRFDLQHVIIEGDNPL